MNTRVGIALQSTNTNKSHLNPRKDNSMDIQGSKSRGTQKATVNRRRSSRERKLVLLQDVDNLKRKLRHEENVHRALERAFSRPLGALPRLPPYLPQHTLELLAEVAVLEEEVVRLEEQVVDFRQGLYHEAIYTSSRRTTENSIDPPVTSSRGNHSRSLSLSEVNLDTSFMARPLPSLSRTASRRKLLSSDPVFDQVQHCSNGTLNGRQPLKKSNSFFEDGLGKENRSRANDKQSPEKNTPTFRTPGKRPPVKPKSAEKCVDSQNLQCRLIEQERTQESSSGSSDDRIFDAGAFEFDHTDLSLNALIVLQYLEKVDRGKTDRRRCLRDEPDGIGKGSSGQRASRRFQPFVDHKVGTNQLGSGNVFGTKGFGTASTL